MSMLATAPRQGGVATRCRRHRSGARPRSRSAQLAALLLEPAVEDGLATWNFFDADLADGKDFPVVRLPKSVPLLTGPVRPLQGNADVQQADSRPEDRRCSFARQRRSAG